MHGKHVKRGIDCADLPISLELSILLHDCSTNEKFHVRLNRSGEYNCGNRDMKGIILFPARRWAGRIIHFPTGYLIL